MREILFKAKTLDGDWVEGDYRRSPIKLSKLFYDSATHIIETEDHGTCEIDRKTLCQYTGLKDKNGDKIFEGDILTDRDGVYNVEWYSGSWEVNGGIEYLSVIKGISEITGNIHDE